jgi:hypothetical protein
MKKRDHIFQNIVATSNIVLFYQLICVLSNLKLLVWSHHLPNSWLKQPSKCGSVLAGWNFLTAPCMVDWFQKTHGINRDHII